MDCWEHETAEQGPVRAVAVCAHCGVGLCGQHASVCEEERFGHNGLGAPSRLLPNGRKICCATCREAFTDAVPAHQAAERTGAPASSSRRTPAHAGLCPHLAGRCRS